MSCLTSFRGGGLAVVGGALAGAWKSSEKRSLDAEGACACGSGATGAGRAVFGAACWARLATLVLRSWCGWGWRFVMDDREAEAFTLDWTGVAVLEGTCGAAVAVGVEGVADPDDWVSSVDGSEGGGPSIAHRRDSYFERMKDSILLSCTLAKREET